MPSTAPRYAVTHMDDVAARPCPCGVTRRAFADDGDGVATIHRVNIRADAQVHHHQRTTEIYYVLEGEGEMELDGERVPVCPHSTVLIKPGCRHRAHGEMTVIVVAVPAFDPGDEFLD